MAQHKASLAVVLCLFLTSSISKQNALSWQRVFLLGGKQKQNYGGGEYKGGGKWLEIFRVQSRPEKKSGEHR